MEEKHFQMFGGLYVSLDLFHFFSRNFKIISFLNKIIFCLIVVYLHDYPMIQMITLLIFKIAYFSSKLCWPPYLKSIFNILLILQEVAYLTIFGINLYLIQLFKKFQSDGVITQEEEDKFFNLDWVMIFFYLYFNIPYFSQPKKDNVSHSEVKFA